MSRELKIIKKIGYAIIALSILLLIYLIKIIPTIDVVAIIYLIVPIITFAGGSIMAFLITES